MASNVHVIAFDAPDGAAERAEQKVRDLEQRWSRFIGASDISRINRSDSGWVLVDRSTLVLLDAMQSGARQTAGRYDPTLLYELVAEGYGSSIEAPHRVGYTVDLPCLSHTIADVVIDPDGQRLWIPPGFGLDPGGIGKGLAADLVVAALLDMGAAGAMVGIGGDLSAAGAAPHASGWRVSIDDPFEPGTSVLEVAVSGGGVATSSTLSRRWTHHGVARHHLLDPTLRTSSSTDLVAVTVIARSGWLAEVHATAAALSGSTNVLEYLSSMDLDGVAITATGDLLISATLQDTARSLGTVA